MRQIYFKKPKILQQRMKICGLLTFIFLGIGTINIEAQESLNTSGGIISNTDGSINQSIGQMFNNPMSDSSNFIYQGVQYAIELTSLNTDSNQYDLSIMAFPNPSSSELNLQVSKVNSTNLRYEMYDLLGHLVKSIIISLEKTRIDIENLPNALYLLNVFSDDNNFIKSFKIIKN